jgi:hypothetical protein
MIGRKKDTAAHAREDAFLGGLIPQVTEYLAEQHAGDFDAGAGQARFSTWLGVQTKESAGSARSDRAELDFAKPGWGRSPSQIMGELLTSHPEAASLLSAAAHWRALAVSSAATTRQRLAAAQAARLSYEELRHRLDARHRRTVNFGAGLAVLVVLAVGIFLELLPAALHGFGFGLGWPAASGPTRWNPVSGSLISALIFVLAVGGAALISRMEPASLFIARRRWHRARAAHKAAIKTEQADLQAAAAAAETWLDLVRAQASAVVGHDEHLAHQTVALAVALVESG